MTKVAVFMGSASDEDLMKPCAEILAKLGIPYLFTVTSAHRTPERTERLVSELEAQGCQVFICAAGMAAHLAGAVAEKESGEPVHFECALERVAAAETLEAGEKVVYLGAGCFGVVSFKSGNEGAFVVKRRLRWEKEGEKQPWRREISSYITKI